MHFYQNFILYLKISKKTFYLIKKGFFRAFKPNPVIILGLIIFIFLKLLSLPIIFKEVLVLVQHRSNWDSQYHSIHIKHQ